ncbi:Activating signal cointegrator 1 complex subunit 1 [Papilio machaon]|uniref:Activating signal cointegrator 1 complex subunit 1 n=1 Tax=Papilio machaon TaxID=76193 RepID=A0A194QNC5_PAPMA|nr:Activating signal cointegrator 1 complex subunit 1 [Papilio machaon]
MNYILRPEVIWIEGRCYRINDPNTEVSALQEHDLYEDEITFQDAGDDDSDDDFEIIEIDSNRFSTNLHVSKHYIGSIIGKKGIMRSRIERDTRTNIKIPKQGEAGDITILGPSVTNVKAARRRINIIIMSSRMKQTPTHFISIPLNDPIIMENFEKFKQIVLQEVKGVDESLFIKSQKLHITIGVMCLMDNEERLQASKLLSEAKDKIIMPLIQENLPLRIRLKGLSYMNDDPKNIHVLYGNVEDEAGTDIIQTIADDLVNFFYKAGFMRINEYGRDRVKLHVTLLNSKYKSKSTNNDETSTTGRNVKEAFDGSEILNKFVDYDFGVTEITNIHLSQRKTFGADGYYQPTFVVTLNNN